jgi:hypothetical protein
MAREINLVPDIKGEMIKTLKLRNLIFFLCIVVALASVVVVLITGLIMGGQQLALDSKEKTIDNLSEKLNSYSDLNDFLTIKDQVGSISTLTENKQVLSRTFNILSALLPTGADTITISELNVDLSESQPKLTFDAQANAGTEPYYDYRVLDAFKKSMKYMRYDYGDYVDKEGNKIPAYCIIETGNDGAMFNDADKGIYALWTINGEGCNPSSTLKDSNYTTEDYDGETVVRIWRTPQFADWYKEKEVSGQPYMSLDGTISGVEHFNSSCITYTGDDSQSSANPKWTTTNETCKLVPDDDGIVTTGSSNGRDSNEELVLRFSATIKIAPEAYKFSNSHMMALAPSGRYNVTDSYVQVQAMFGKRADDCDANDSTCQTAPSSDTNSDSDSQNTSGGN